MKRTAVTPTIISLDPSFRRHLRAANLSPRTEAVYGYGLADLARFLEAQEMPQEVASISREHLESYFEDLLSRRKPATALAYFKGLQQFWKWAEDEGDVSRSPMSKMRPPRVAQNPPPVLSVEQVRALLEACSGNNFEDRRDAALVRLFCDTGARLAEVVGMKLEDVDLDQGIAVVTGKGSCIRLLPIGGKTIKAIDRYMRARASHPEADAPELWIGRKGRMGPSGVQQMLRRRSREAGIPTVNPHAFRHTFAHRWQADGGNESDLIAHRMEIEADAVAVRRQCRHRASDRRAPPTVAGRQAPTRHREWERLHSGRDPRRERTLQAGRA